MDTKDKLVERLKELIIQYQIYCKYGDRIHEGIIAEFYIKRLKSEIAALEKQIKEQESITFKEPEFDEATVKKLDMVRELADKKAGKKEQKSKPVYDEAYLNECIAKAMPNLSKIKDVDKHLVEIRGEQESISDEEWADEYIDKLSNLYLIANRMTYRTQKVRDAARESWRRGMKTMRDKLKTK